LAIKIGRESIRKYSLCQSLLLIGPLLFLFIIFYLYPLVSLIPESVIKGGHFTSEHYVHFFKQPLYSHVLIRTLRIGLMATVISFIIGYPFAYFLSEIRNQKLSNFLLVLVLLPFFTSILVRSYSWTVLFQTKGIINNFLLSHGLIREPLALMYNEPAVLIGMVHVLLPFMVLPIHSVLKNLDKNLIRAARNLGAGPLRAFSKVTFPLSLPGVGAGVIMVFILSLGFFITPALLGGPKTLMITTLIDQQINRLMNWEFAAAIAVVLLLATILMMVIFDRLVGLDKVYKE
jgi:ABC-type spermidine/putrescine transport system permease subunit I